MGEGKQWGRKACSSKMGTMEEITELGIRLVDEMTGHPSMARYREDGFDVITRIKKRSHC